MKPSFLCRRLVQTVFLVAAVVGLFPPRVTVNAVGRPLFGSNCLPRIQWQRAYGSSGHEFLTQLLQTTDGGYLFGGEAFDFSGHGVGGNKTSPDHGQIDFWVVRTDANGNILWDHTFGGTLDDNLLAMQQTSDEGFILGGLSNSDASGNKSSPKVNPGLVSRDFWIVRLDAHGDKLWDRSYGGGSSDYFTSLDQTTDGGFIIGGRSESGVGGNKTSPSLGGDDIWIIRIDALGNPVWDRSFGGDEGEDLGVARQTSDGGFVLGGTSFSGPSGNKTSPRFDDAGVTGDYWVVRLDANGSKLWDHSYGGSNYEYLRGLQETSDRGFILAGTSDDYVFGPSTNGNKTSLNFGGEDGWAVRIDAQGDILWDRSFGGSDADSLRSVLALRDGGFVLGGSSSSPADGNKTAAQIGGYDFWVVRLDAHGSKLWDQVIGGSETDGSNDYSDLQATADGGLILGGGSYSGANGDKTLASFGESDFWVIKLDRESPDACDSDGDGVPDDRDQCPNTLPGSIVNAHGCSIAQICPCDGAWHNHGEYVRCVIEQAWDLFRARLVTIDQRRAAIRDAARSNCGHHQAAVEPLQMHLLPLTPAECRASGLQVVITGVIVGESVIETSTDLVHWTLLQTLIDDAIGNEIACSPAADGPTRFYRVRPVQ